MSHLFRRPFPGPDGRPRLSSRYTLEFADAHGHRRRVTLFRDRSACQEAQRKIERLVDLARASSPVLGELRSWIHRMPSRLRRQLADNGLIPSELFELARPLVDLLEDFRQSILDRGKTRKHANDVTEAAKRVFDACGFVLWEDIRASAVERFLAGERRAGLSHRRSNALAAAAGQLTRWVLASGWAVEDPLRPLKPLSVDADRRRIRRAFTVEEIKKLVSTTEASEPLMGASGPERAAAYLLAIESGLRQAELLALEVRELDLGPLPAVRLRGSATKNRQEARIPLRQALADRLRVALDLMEPDERVFRLIRPAQMLQEDLAAAGIRHAGSLNKPDASGLVLDWHSFRYTTGTLLARAGVALQVTQRVLRHSSPKLTDEVYTDLGAEDERAALERLPMFHVEHSGPKKHWGRHCTQILSQPDAVRHVDPTRNRKGDTGKADRGWRWSDSNRRSSDYDTADKRRPDPPEVAAGKPGYGDREPPPGEQLGAPLGVERLLELWDALTPEARREFLARIRRAGERRP